MRYICTADFDFLPSPRSIGTLEYLSLPGKGDRCRFTFDKSWLEEFGSLLPLGDKAGQETIFSQSLDIPFITDSLPDRWGRTLIQRRLASRGKKGSITDLDYLIGVDDYTRSGALRFSSEDGTYLAAENNPVPPIARLPEFETMLTDYEERGAACTALNAFFSPSSSLGGARPKLNVIDSDGCLYIAKVPSLHDDYDVGMWEALVLRLAQDAGIRTAENRAIAASKGFHSLISKRFDRDGEKRIHIASIHAFIPPQRREDATFIDVAQVISQESSRPDEDLEELYRRLVFFTYVGNTDNHLRNHSLVLTKGGWRLSPAYDINPSPRGRESALAIDDGLPWLDIEAVRSTSPYYGLREAKAKEIEDEVRESVSRWRLLAKGMGLSSDTSMMEAAFLI